MCLCGEDYFGLSMRILLLSIYQNQISCAINYYTDKAFSHSWDLGSREGPKCCYLPGPLDGAREKAFAFHCVNHQGENNGTHDVSVD